MKCTNCGSETNDGYNVCPHCHLDKWHKGRGPGIPEPDNSSNVELPPVAGWFFLFLFVFGFLKMLMILSGN